MEEKVYTIGKGKLMFKPDGENNYRDLGNCPDFKIAIAAEKKEHFSSKAGIQEKDAEVVVKQTASGSLTLDDLIDFNLKSFIMSNAITNVAQGSGSITDQALTSALDRWQNLGKKKISTVVVTGSGGTPTYVLGTDYALDTESGLIMPLSEGSIAEAQSLLVDFAYAAITVKRLDAATATTLKGHVWFVGDPPVGRILDVKGYASLSPNGDLSLIGEDWTQFGFSLEFVSSTDYTGLFELIDRGKVT